MENTSWTRWFAICRDLALVGILLLLAGNGTAVAIVLRERLLLCLETLVPSLFACMAAANLLLRSGAAEQLGRLFSRPARLDTCTRGHIRLFTACGLSL